MRIRNTGSTRTLVGVIAGLALIVSACGSDGDSTSESDDSLDAPVATESADPAATTAPPGTDLPGDTSVPADGAQRVISLSPTHTEIMFAIGAGDQLIAVDDYSNYPAEALELPHELSGFEPNVEAIAAYDPDLVLIGGDFTGLGDQLDSIDIASWDGPAVLVVEDTYAQIEQLGALTGHVAEAASLVASMQTEMAAIVAESPVPDEPLTYYHELGADLYSVDSTTFIGELYGMLGLRNIADLAEAGDSGGYPQLNAEFIVSADPDLIFLADTKCCGESLATVGARPGWESMTAVVNGNVIEMDDDIASRWGPRIVDYLAEVAKAVEQAAVPA